MKNIFCYSVSVLIAVFSTKTFAGPRVVGNGGFVIQCGEVVQLFDYYQAAERGLHIIQIPGHTLEEKVESLLQRLQKVDPNRAINYRHQFQLWSHQKTLQVDGLRLNSVQALDPGLQARFGLGSIQIPEHCQLALAIQQDAPLETSSQSAVPFRRLLQTQRFLPVWNNLDLDTQAGLIMHELFYEEFILRDVSSASSQYVRYLNGLLASQEFSNVDVQMWMEELKANLLTPMFPLYKLLGASTPGYDMTYDKTSPGVDYLVRPQHYLAHYQFEGPLVLCGAPVIVKTMTNLFLDGLYPQVSMIANAGVFDLSCYSNSGTLRLNLDKKIPIHLFRQSEAQPMVIPKLFSIGATLNPENNPLLWPSFIETYTNPNVQILGPVYAQIRWSADMKKYILYLKKTSFSDIKVFASGTWTDVNNSCAIDLSTGQSINMN